MSDPYELWLWVWLGLILLAWLGALAFSAWVDRRRPRRVMRDWSTELKDRHTRRGLRTKAGIR